VSDDGFDSIAGIVRRWAAETPDRPCLSQGQVSRTWSEVYDRSARVAAALIDAGVQPQDRVAILARNDAAFFEVCFGASMVGGVNLGVNFRLAPNEVLEILNHADAKVLVIGTDLLGHLACIEADLVSVSKIVVLGGDGSGHEAYDDWLRRYDPVDQRVPVRETDTVIQMYTSGTTGLPKGVMYNNAAVHASLGVANDIGIRNESVVMIAMPLFHASGSSWGIFSLAFGCHCVVMPELAPGDIVEAIERHRITETMLAPVLLQGLVGMPDLSGHDLSSLETIAYAGSPISPHLLAQCVEVFPCDFLQIYGMTETLTATILSPADHRDAAHPERLASAGQACTNVTVKVVDPDTGLDRPQGQVGEVWIKAPTNTHGYWRDPVQTAAVLTTDGFVRTGDGGMLEQGYLFLRDRIKDMIVSGGENVYPIEVENVLITHPDLADVTVIGVPSERWGETVKAVAVPAPGSAPDASKIIAYARAHLAGYKCPTSVDFVNVLPRNPAGKVLKRELRAPFWSGFAREVN
jgi:long-chain acyl-CoA synthetase